MPESIAAGDLRGCIEGYAAQYPATTGDPKFWRPPLLATAKADRRFELLKRIAAADHTLPQDHLPTARAVVVFFAPFTRALAVENHKGDTPCRSWGLAYEATNRLIERLCEHLQQYLQGRGYQSALTPATHNFDPVTLISRWSHKHLGHLAGLGRFGVNAQFITPSGCTGRLGSLITDADLGDSPLVRDDELCLHKKGLKCLVCVKRCPVQAVSEAGIDRPRCWERLNFNRDQSETLQGLETTTHVCGKCQVLVPCSLEIPKSSPPEAG